MNDISGVNENKARILSDIPVRQRPVLRQGDTGAWVLELQKQLKTVTFYNGPINGNFDAATNTAVRAFQQVNRLVVDGVVGINTWSGLIFLYSPLAICDGPRPPEIPNMPTVRQGSQGDAVRELQTMLNTLGFNTGGITGIFGPLTDSAVRTFQRNNNLTVDGIVGPMTWAALFNAINPPTTPEPPPGSSNYYTVVAGDTLWSIATRFNTTVAAIKRLNNLTGNNLNIGQVLLISSNNNQITYTVVAGDTLWNIANRFNTTVAEIKRLNNLTNNNLNIGQVLIIASNNNQITHVVAAGDTLWSIATRFNTTVTAIKQLNNLTSNVLAIGQILLIPA